MARGVGLHPEPLSWAMAGEGGAKAYRGLTGTGWVPYLPVATLTGVSQTRAQLADT